MSEKYQNTLKLWNYAKIFNTHFIFYKNRPDQNEAQIFLTFFILRLKIFLKNSNFSASAKNIILNNRNLSLRYILSNRNFSVFGPFSVIFRINFKNWGWIFLKLFLSSKIWFLIFKPEAGNILRLFLFFDEIWAWDSYKLDSYKK